MMWKTPSTSMPIVLATMVTVAITAQLIVPTTSSELTLVPSEEHEEASCPTCDLYFSKLDISLASEGTGSQYVKLRERGEPKSGTGFAFEWAAGALVHACEHLRRFFGEKSCTIDLKMSNHEDLPDLALCSFNFEPRKGLEDARCPCSEVERVSILAESGGKHHLPVENNCSWAHGGGVSVGGHSVCTFPDGSRPSHYGEIWDCMEENRCHLTAGDVQQMAVFRDPRAVAVSTYFWKSVYKTVDEKGQPVETLDAYVLRVLPILSQWIAVRHILFGEYLAEQSTIFWYDEIKANPVEYHRKWLASVGLHLPGKELESAAETALRGEFDFWIKGFDPHPGSSDHPQKRTFRDELSNDTLAQMDPILRQWLPPVFLSKIGVSRA